jgi:hypothetical protein
LSLFWEQKSNQKTLLLAELIPALPIVIGIAFTQTAASRKGIFFKAFGTSNMGQSFDRSSSEGLIKNTFFNSVPFKRRRSRKLSGEPERVHTVPR